MSNKISHIEFMGADGAGQRDFYSSIFGWATEEVPGFDQYYMVSADVAGAPGAAIGKGPEPSPNYLTVYIDVESIDDTLEAIGAAGGHTVMPRTVIPNVVTFAMFTDPAGNLVGLTEADSG